MIEWIIDGDKNIALIIKSGYLPHQTEFLTPSSYNQQVGFIVYGKGGWIKPHEHKNIKRIIEGTSELLIVKKGKMEAFFFSEKQEYIVSKIVGVGDIILLVGGGHSFKMIEDTILLEIKQGPFLADKDKDYFSPNNEV